MFPVMESRCLGEVCQTAQQAECRGGGIWQLRGRNVGPLAWSWRGTTAAPRHRGFLGREWCWRLDGSGATYVPTSATCVPPSTTQVPSSATSAPPNLRISLCATPLPSGAITEGQAQHVPFWGAPKATGRGAAPVLLCASRAFLCTLLICR